MFTNRVFCFFSITNRVLVLYIKKSPHHRMHESTLAASAHISILTFVCQIPQHYAWPWWGLARQILGRTNFKLGAQRLLVQNCIKLWEMIPITFELCMQFMIEYWPQMVIIMTQPLAAAWLLMPDNRKRVYTRGEVRNLIVITQNRAQFSSVIPVHS